MIPGFLDVLLRSPNVGVSLVRNELRFQVAHVMLAYIAPETTSDRDIFTIQISQRNGKDIVAHAYTPYMAQVIWVAVLAAQGLENPLENISKVSA